MGRQWFGVMGDPVMHSVSPAMMNVTFATIGLDAVYLAFHVPAGAVSEAVRGLKVLGATGVNVTIPHKQTVLNLADEKSPEAELAGAANTLMFRADGTVYAHNTDIEGWWGSVAPALSTDWNRTALLGAGGAARAVLTALSLRKPGAQVGLVVRDVTKAKVVHEQFADRLHVAIHPWSERMNVILASDLVVNTTSLGMWPHDDGSPVDDARCFRADQVVQDLVYAPLDTRFLKLARSAGATTVDGLGMLVGQGAAALHMWTGQAAPLDVMRKAAEAALRGRRTHS